MEEVQLRLSGTIIAASTMNTGGPASLHSVVQKSQHESNKIAIRALTSKRKKRTIPPLYSALIGTQKISGDNSG